MKRFLPWAAAAAFLAACATVPYTGRRQFNLLSGEQETQLGTQAYDEILKQNKPTDNAEWQALVQKVGNDLKRVANQPDYEWEFNVLAGKDVNAFALPGGKVAFWEGIMPICGGPDGVAVVMGHEIAHALAHHGAERVSQAMGAEIVAQVLSVGLANSDPQVRQNVMQFYGIGAQVGVLLPFSRKQESESDHIGLILMAKAGYDPRESVEFWKRMGAAAKDQAKPPEFLSTHPSDERRIKQLEDWIPEAMVYYNR